MARNLSLSQAARLIGVTRKEIQKKIQQNQLRVMEGTVLLEDLKNAYPEASYEDNTMLEKTQKLMKDAVYKMAQSEHEGAQLNALSRRAHQLNQELAKQKSKADYLEQVLNQLRHKFIELSTNHSEMELDTRTIAAIQQWLQEKMENIASEQQSAEQALSERIEQFMQPHIRLLPSRHDFISDKSQTILESALASGLAVDYGCNNGRCGKCKVKLVSGQVKNSKPSDYVFTQQEKSQNFILTCVCNAVTDIILETHEAVSVEDIPKQTINCKVKSLERTEADIFILNLKTPRSQRLRFLAGQNIKLYNEQLVDSLTAQPAAIDMSIASCPCDDRNIQFHFNAETPAPLLQALISNPKSFNEVSLQGPSGHFILDEDSPRSIVFIAQEIGFAAIKSLIEHALALDLESHIHLIWLTTEETGQYMSNLCRAWNDALDNFAYHPMMITAPDNAEKIAKKALSLETIKDNLSRFDFYLSTSENVSTELKNQLLKANCHEAQLHIAPAIEGK